MFFSHELFILLIIYAHIRSLQTIVRRVKETPLPKLFYKYRESGFLNLEQTFGHVLQRHRISSQMSQEELSFNSGLDRTYISLLERGKRKPTINTVFALANALNIKPSQLIKELEIQVSDKT